jgi:hypothetical protein
MAGAGHVAVAARAPVGGRIQRPARPKKRTGAPLYLSYTPSLDRDTNVKCRYLMY